METYKVIFKGEISEGKDALKIEQSLAKFLKIPPEKSNILFNGKSFAIKKGLTKSSALSLQEKLKRIGIVVHIVKGVEISENLSYQEDLEKDQKASTQIQDYATTMDGKKCCKYCGSELSTDNIESRAKKSEKYKILSKSWEQKFTLFDELDAANTSVFQILTLPAYKSLPLKDRISLTTNIWAFLFGPLYYLFQKMWFKAAALIGLTWFLGAILSLIEIVLGHPIHSALYWIPVSVLCLQMANHDYYRFHKKGETIWPILPNILSKPIGAISLPIVALFLLISVNIFTPTPIPAQTLTDVSGYWITNSDGTVVRIDFISDQKTLNVGGVKLPVKIQTFDSNTSTLTLEVSLQNGQKATWGLHQKFDNQNNFTLQMVLHDGNQEGLSFLKNI